MFEDLSMHHVIIAALILVIILLIVLQPMSKFKNYIDQATPAQPNSARYYMFAKQ